ncbi:MAG: ATP-binding protein, partial [Nostoc sp.]
MMARSLRVAPEYIEKVKSALQRNGYPSQQSLATDTEFCLATVKSFLNGKPVDFQNFVKLSEKLGLKWEDIAYKEPETQLNKPQPTNGEASPFITGAPITQPRYFFGREKELKRLFNLLKCH